MPSAELRPNEKIANKKSPARFNKAITPYSPVERWAVRIGIKSIEMVCTSTVPTPYIAEPERRDLKGEV
jgi:hypothetical protein